MKEKRMLEHIGQVKEQFIEEAAPKGLLEEQPPAKHKKAVSYTWLKWAALAACLCVVVGIGVKTALPMFETVDDAATNDTNTSITTVDNNLITEDTTTIQITAESGIVSFPDWGLSLSVKNVSATGLTLVVAQSGGEPTGTLETGETYRIITLVDGAWRTVEELPLPEGVDARAWNSIAYLIPMEDSREFDINWSWIYGELPAGTYRLIKGFMDFRETANYDTFDYWVEFEIQ